MTSSVFERGLTIYDNLETFGIFQSIRFCTFKVEFQNVTQFFFQKSGCLHLHKKYSVINGAIKKIKNLHH